MRTSACLIAAVLAVASIFEARAEPIAYGIAFDELYRIDLGTRQATFVGVAGNHAGSLIGQVSGLSYGPNGQLYGVAGTHKALVRFNASTGAATYVGSLGVSGSGNQGALDLALTYGCEGSFWMTSAITRELWKVDPGNGAATRVGNLGRQISGLSVRQGILYGTGINADAGLYTIDPTTAQATRVGGYGGATPPWVEIDLDGADTLWSVLSYNPPEDRMWNDIARIDPATGAMTNLGQLTGPSRLRYLGMRGLAVGPNTCERGDPDPDPDPPATPATLPVRSPAGLALLAFGLLLLAGRTLRRRFP